MQTNILFALKNKDELQIPNYGYYKLENQAKFHPLKYCEGLRKAAEKYGAHFYEHTEVLGIEYKETSTIHTAQAKVAAKWAVISTYNPFNKPLES